MSDNINQNNEQENNQNNDQQNTQEIKEQQQKETVSQGIPSVNKRGSVKKAKSGSSRLFLFCILVGALALGLTYWQYIKTPATSSDKNQAVSNLTSNNKLVRSTVPYQEENSQEQASAYDYDANQAITESSQAPVQTEVQALPSLVPETNQATSSALDNIDVDVGPSLEQLKFAAPMMGNTQSSSSTSSNSGIYTAEDQKLALENIQKLANQSGNPGVGGGAPTLSQQMGSMSTPASQARVVTKPSLTLAKGTVIECILESRVDTSVPGMTTCVIPQNVYSMDGRVLLVEKGTKAIGEYQGSVQNGLERIFMLWSELRTPEGIAVQIDSPTADALGGAGTGGYVDHHWWKRFGNALMFSMVADAFDFAITKAENSNNGISYDNSSDGIDEIIKEAMNQSGRIPPTLFKNQGEKVSIFVARDVDFSSVYNLKKKEL